MANLPLAFAELLAGAVVLDSAIKGDSIANVIRGKATGHPIAGLTGSSSASSSATSTSTAPAAKGSGTAPSGGTVVGLVTWGQLAAVGAKHGWTGQQIKDWAAVVKSESNGTLSDTNPSSGAYGIAQFIQGKGEYATYGGNANTVDGQLIAMANYIKQRYGNPSAAWSFHQSHNWY